MPAKGEGSGYEWGEWGVGVNDFRMRWGSSESAVKVRWSNGEPKAGTQPGRLIM